MAPVVLESARIQSWDSRIATEGFTRAGSEKYIQADRAPVDDPRSDLKTPRYLESAQPVGKANLSHAAFRASRPADGPPHRSVELESEASGHTTQNEQTDRAAAYLSPSCAPTCEGSRRARVARLPHR